MEKQLSSTSNFRLFCAKILLPVLLTVVVGGGGLVLLFKRYVIYGSTASGVSKMYRINKITDPDEIPIFGSSRADNSFLPDTLGEHYYDYGIPGTKYDVTLYFIERECQKQKRTPYILSNIDLDGLVRGYGDVNNYIPFAYQAEVREILGKDFKPYYSVPFVKYYGTFQQYLKDYLNEQMEATKYIDKGARLPNTYTNPEAFAAMVADRKEQPLEFLVDTPLQNRLLRLVQAHTNRHFVFIVSPYHSSCFARTPRIAKFHELKRLLLQHPNVTFWDFSRLPLLDAMFLNTTHLNVYGASAFSKVVRDSMNALQARHAVSR